jgi:hypothetical protein
VPREIVILAPRHVTLEDVVEAAATVDPGLSLRVVAKGAFTQLVNDDEQVVVSIGQPSPLLAPDEVGRLHPNLAVQPEVLAAVRNADPAAETGSLPTWTEAHAPLTEAGATGGAVCTAIARHVGGTCHVQDGTYWDVL